MTSKLSPTIAAAVALAVPAGATALASPPPLPAKCTYKVEKSYSLTSVKRHGIPVAVTCDKAIKVSALVDMLGKPEKDWEDMHPHGIPGIAIAPITPVGDSGSATTRVRITTKAARFLGRYQHPRLRLLLGEDIGKGIYQSVDSGKVIVLR
jgi:hypothetical protein